MARPYSLDLRERVVAQVAGGMSCHEAAELNGLAPSTVVKWTQRQRTTGSAAAKAMGGKRPYLLEGERDWLLTRIREKPDLTLHGIGTYRHPRIEERRRHGAEWIELA